MFLADFGVKNFQKKISEFEAKLNSTQLSQSDHVNQLENEIKLLKETNISIDREKADKNSQILKLVKNLEIKI